MSCSDQPLISKSVLYWIKSKQAWANLLLFSLNNILSSLTFILCKYKTSLAAYLCCSLVNSPPQSEDCSVFEIDFPSKLVSKQSCQLQLVNGNYKSDIASARTFGFERDVDMLRSNGLALGGSLDNAVVVGESKILNSEGLRFKDEFVRHKILDSIGDLYLAGSPIQGYFCGNKSGHHLNNLLLRLLFADKDNYEYI